jgi:hypothetical protein
MILTNTRFRRRPSRLPGQPFRLALKDLLPRAKIKPAIRHRHHHLSAHDLPLQVRVGIPVTAFRTGVFAGAVVLVLADGGMGGQPFQPFS